MNGQVSKTKLTRRQLLLLRIKNCIYQVTRKIAFWLGQKLRRLGVGTPKFFKEHSFLARWLGGLDQFCHTHWCGHGLKFSGHMGNIYWKILSKESHDR